MKRVITLLFILSVQSLFSVEKSYLIVGDQYTKNPYSDFKDESDPINKLVRNTVFIKSGSRGHSFLTEYQVGTGFYIGKHKGLHLFLTNNHVLNQRACSHSKISFFTSSNLDQQKSVRCHKVLLTISHRNGSDLTLFTVRESELKKFIGEGLEIDFDFIPTTFTPLAHAGFGNHLPRDRGMGKVDLFDMHVNNDEDCVIASQDSHFQTVKKYGVNHNFATGCDIAVGDSGGAFISLETGKVVGIGWAILEIGDKSSSELQQDIFGQDSEYIWKYMSFAIGLSQLKDVLLPYLE